MGFNLNKITLIEGNELIGEKGGECCGDEIYVRFIVWDKERRNVTFWIRKSV